MEINIAEGSALSYSSALDLFTIQNTDAGILNSEYYPCFPISSYQDSASNPIQFIINPSTNLLSLFAYNSLLSALPNTETGKDINRTQYTEINP